MRTACALLLCAIPYMAYAAAVPDWKIDSKQSTITFTATQNSAPVSGKFTSFKGQIQFSPEQLSASKVTISIDMNSINTSYAAIADTLKTEDWLSVKIFPQAVFKSNKVTKIADNTYLAEGNLSIRDKTQAVGIKFDVDQFSKDKAHAKGSFTLKRTPFGIGQGDWSNTDEIKDEVNVKFDLTLTLA